MAGLPQPKVEPRAISTPFSEERAIDTSAGLERTFDRLGQIGEQGAKKLGELYDREKHKANVLAVTNTLTALQQAGNDALYGKLNDDGSRTPGYLDTKGLDAQANGADAFQSLQDRVAGAVEGLQSPEQKEMLKEHAPQLLEHWDSTIHEHAFQQTQAARVDGVNAAKAEAIRTAALNPTDDNVARAAVARVVGAQDALVTSPADALAKADQVDAEVTQTRLDVLLAQPGGWQKADELFNKKKALLGPKADDYERRIEHGKVAAIGAVEANRIVDAALPSVAAQRYFRMPDENVVEAELGKLAGRDPKLYEIAAPIARAQLAFRKNAVKEQKDQFVDQAVATYNNNHAQFFSSDIADRLNHVDPDKYRSLWNETYQRAKSAGDSSAQARREQKARDDEAWNDFKSMDPNERATADVTSFAAGRDLSPVGVSRLGMAQQEAKAVVGKGLAVPQEKFVTDATADAQGFLPAAQTKKQREQRAMAEKQFKARADTAFAAFVEKHKRQPTPDEADDLRAGLVKGKVPLTSDAAELAGRAAVIGVNGAPQPARKVEVVDEKGNRGLAPETGLDAWLAAHPKWKRR